MTAPDRPLVGEERVQLLARHCVGHDMAYIADALRIAIKEAGEECAKIADDWEYGETVAREIRRRL